MPQLTTEHLRRRDEASEALNHAHARMESVVEIEAGNTQGDQSERHKEVRQLSADIKDIDRRLQALYK